MRKGNMTILASIFAVVLVAGVGGAGILAYFSDVETSTGNTLTAGTIDLEIGITTVTFNDLKPCEPGYITIELINVGINPMWVWKHISGIVCAENVVVEPELEYYLANNIDPATGKNDIDTVMNYDLYIEVYDDVGALVYDDLLIDLLDNVMLADVFCLWIELGVLLPGETMIVHQSYHLLPETENWAQSDTITIDIDFLATQVNQSPSPTWP